jgi:hypothetical protein
MGLGEIFLLESELKEVSVWIKSDDKDHCDYSGALELSEGGNYFFHLMAHIQMKFF